MKRILLLALAALAAAAVTLTAAAAQGGAIEVSITSPAAGAHSLSGVVPVQITASADAGIYSVQLYVDGNAYDTPQTVAVSQYQYEIDWNTSGLSMGDHSLSALATDWSDQQLTKMSASVNVDVGPPYPTIALTSPHPNTYVRGTALVTAGGTTGDAPATVQFAVDGTPIGMGTAQPWAASWPTTGLSDGSHTVTATVTDARGKTATDSAQVTVDNTPPTVAITSPASGSYNTGTLAAQANASDAYGISSVQFALDGSPVGSPVTQPDSPGGYLYSAALDISALSTGTHTLTAVATDNAGNVTTSSARPFKVGIGPPAATWTTPPDWSYARGTAIVTASVTGGTAPMTVSFKVDGTKTSVPTSVNGSAYTFTWDTTKVLAGTHSLTVSVTDSQNRSATSPTLHITVDNTAPTVSVLSPTAGSYASGTLSAQAHASDAYGVKTVQFAVDGTPVGTAVTQPDTSGGYTYSASLDISNLTGGTHTVTATATDNAGNVSTSAPVSFSVGTAPATVSLTAPADWSFSRGTVLVSATIAGGAAPLTVQLLVDGTVASASPTVNGSTYSFSLDSTKLVDGAHTVAVSVTDGQSRSVTSGVAHITVDNTAPTVYVTAPTAGQFASATLAAQAHASDASGITSVQFALDGTPAGTALTQSDQAGSYLYSETLDISTLAAGSHQLTVTATDSAGNTSTSARVSFTIGAAPPSIVLTMPPDWTYASGVYQVTATVTGGTAPLTVKLVIDGVASTVVPTVNGTGYAFAWDTTRLIDGSHTVAASATDGQNRTVTAPVANVTVDNTPPSATMYLPAANDRDNGPTTFQVHASDVFGVKSVQFTVDGTPVGVLLTQPDTAGSYLYTSSFDTSTLTAGTHAVSALVTDNAGNKTTAPSVSITTGQISYLPVLNYHEINPPDGYSIYDQTPAEADAQLAYMNAQGYQSVTLEQYQQWLSGANIGIAKPVLITVDDGLKSEQAWDPLLQKYGFKAVLFVITGYADNTTPGDSDPNNMTWTQIQTLAANGRWEIAFHAGQYGHGDSYDTGAKIGSATYTTACPYFYTCLNQTVTGSGKNKKTTVETVAAFKTAVTNEVTAGMAELKSKVPSASFVAWAAPFNDAGQWTNLYNDTSNQVQAWLPGFMASKFPITFTQTNPVTYGQASGTVGALTAYGRHYRFEVHTDTTLAQLAAALADPAFGR